MLCSSLQRLSSVWCFRGLLLRCWKQAEIPLKYSVFENVGGQKSTELAACLPKQTVRGEGKFAGTAVERISALLILCGTHQEVTSLVYAPGASFLVQAAKAPQALS